MRWNLVGAFIRNNPFGTEIAFRKGLDRIGEDVVVVDPSYPDQEFDDAPDVTVVFKWLDPGPYRDTLARLPGKKIVYQVDDLRFPHIKQMMLEMRKHCEYALTFDDDGARLAQSYGYKHSKRLLLTADECLYRPVSVPKDMDVCFVGSLSNGENHRSRVKMLQILGSVPGLRVGYANEVFDIPKICEIYGRSKIVLNHATDVGQPFGHGFGYQCRHFEAGFARSCVLSNVVDNDNTLQNIETFDSEKSLVEKVRQLLADQGRRERLADGLYSELYSKHLPEHRARDMVKFVEEIS